MGCIKCGARAAARSIPTYDVTLEPESDDERTAEVYFQKHLKIDIEGVGVREFYVTNVWRLSFTLINLLLSVEPDCLYFRRIQEKALYDASF